MPRGRPIKKVHKNIENTDPDPQLILLESEETPESKSKSPAKVVKTVRTEQWTEKPTKVDGVLEIQQDEEWDDEEVDIWDSVFDDFGPSDSDWGLRVWRLPTAAKDGKFSVRSANREYCDDLPLMKDYLQLIKDTWGAGIYQIELREKAKMRKRKTLHIAPFNTPSISNNGHTSRVNNNGQVVINPIDPMEQVEASLNLITKMRRAFGMGDTNALPQQQQQGLPLTDESAFMHLAMKNDDVIDILGRKFRTILKGGSDEREVTTNDLLLAGIQNLPAMIQEAKKLLVEVLTMRNGQPALAPGPAPQQAQPPQPTTPQPHNEITSGVAPTVPHEQAAVDYLLGVMSEFCSKNQDVSYVANWIATYEDLDRNQHHQGIASCITPYIDLWMSTDAAAILEWMPKGIPQLASMASLPHVKDWLAGVQKELKAMTEPEPSQAAKVSEST